MLEATGRACVAVPAWNCGPFIDEVIERLNALNLGLTIIVVDDFSSDDTFDRASRHPNVVAYRNEQNVGYGGTTTRLYQIASELGASYVVNIHGDLGHRPEDVVPILETLSKQEHEVVVGSRLVFLKEQFESHGIRMLIDPELRGQMSLIRLAGHFGLTFVQNAFFNLSLHSYHEGMRGCTGAFVEWVLSQDLPQWYDYDTNLLASAAANGFRIAEIPSPPHYSEDANSSAPPLRYGFRVLANTIRSFPQIRAASRRKSRE